jgi:hypothetical protein
MKPLILFSCLFFILGGMLAGQEYAVRGRVIDKKTRQPVIGANLVLPGGTGTYSMEEGRFTLKITEFPADIRISHLSYGSTVVTLNFAPVKDLVVELEEQVSEIGEVQVTARRLRILTQKEDFSIQDFAFDNENLWLLGYTGNQAGRGRLWLAGWFGDTITSVPVTGAQSLYRDVFGTVHLILKDSVIQLFGRDNRIFLPYSMGRTDFLSLIEPIRSGFAGKLVYMDLDPWNKSAQIYYRDEFMPGKQWIAVVEDSAGRRDRMLEQKVGSMWLAFAGRYPVMTGSKVSQVIGNPVRVPLFAWRDTLFIINLYKDSLLSYQPSGKFKRAVPFTYGSDRKLTVSLHVMADPIGTGLYFLERRNSRWILMPLDTNTGNAGQPVQLPDYPDMFRITVFANAVYFLYPEKKFPYYVRMFRYQL